MGVKEMGVRHHLVQKVGEGEGRYEGQPSNVTCGRIVHNLAESIVLASRGLKWNESEALGQDRSFAVGERKGIGDAAY